MKLQTDSHYTCTWPGGDARRVGLIHAVPDRHGLVPIFWVDGDEHPPAFRPEDVTFHPRVMHVSPKWLSHQSPEVYA